MDRARTVNTPNSATMNILQGKGEGRGLSGLHHRNMIFVRVNLSHMVLVYKITYPFTTKWCKKLTYSRIFLWERIFANFADGLWFVKIFFASFCIYIYTLGCIYIHNGGIDAKKYLHRAPFTNLYTTPFTNLYTAPFTNLYTIPFTNLYTALFH